MCTKIAIVKSIRPLHICNIANGDKDMEVSSTAPKDWVKYLSGKTSVKPQPRKVLMYCTKGKIIIKSYGSAKLSVYTIKKMGKTFGYDWGANCNVVGYFTLNEVIKIKHHKVKDVQSYEFCGLEYPNSRNSCLSFNELNHYLKGKDGYGWLIDDLHIFERPRPLKTFNLACDIKFYPHREPCSKCKCCKHEYQYYECDKSIKRAPQNYLYCEDDL